MGWETKKLGEACDVRDGTHDSPKYQDVGFPLITSKNLKPSGLNFEKVKYICKEDYQSISKRSGVSEGDILFAMIGTIGNPIIVGNEIEFAIKNVALIKKNDSVNNYYMKYFLGSNATITKMRVEAKGSTQKFVSLGYLRSFEIPLPPLKTQARIVSILDSAFADIERARANAEKNLKNARELFDSYLNKVFTEGGNGWENETFDEVCVKITDGAHHSPKTLYPDREPNRFLYITSKNIRNNYMDLSKTSYVDSDFHNSIYKSCNPEIGDVLLTKDGANTGNVTLNTVDEPFSLLSSVCLMKPDKNRIKAEFIKFYILSPVGFENITGQMTGAAIKRIILKTIKSSIIPVPPLREQKEIISRLNQLLVQKASLEAAYKNKLKSLDELKQSLLQKAFSGELTKEDEGIAA